MTTIRCLAIDDEPLALNVLEDCIRQIPELELVEKFTNSVKALDFLAKQEVDLVFADIQMPDLTGLELIAQLKYKPVLILTTAFSEYALEGFKADALDYLLKPIDFPEFERAVNKAKDWIYTKRSSAMNIRSNQQFLFIKSEYRIVRINFEEIIYIQGMSEYVRIHLSSGKPIMSLISLKSVESQLPTDKFMRVHKSYIVHLDKIHTIERNEIVYDDGTVIPIGPQYKEAFQAYLERNFLV